MTTDNSFVETAHFGFTIMTKWLMHIVLAWLLIVLKAFEENSGTLVTWADIKHDYVLDLTTCLW